LHSVLAAVEAAPPVAAVDVLASELAKSLGARDVSFLITDYSGDALVRLSRAGVGWDQEGNVGDTVALAGSEHEQVVRTQRLQVLASNDGTRVLAPVTNRGDVIGVLELLFSTDPDTETVKDVAAAAHLLGYIVIANRRFTDLFEWGQRSMPLSLAAEIQRRLLPTSLTCEAGQFTVAGALQPAGNIGGDTFDYSLDRGVLHVSLTDAMGHEEDAALLATLLVGSLRNSRRSGASPTEQAARANAAVIEHGHHDQFATGQLLRIDLTSATAGIVNAGHHKPLRVRNGLVERIELATDLPFGMLADTAYRLQPFALQPGDRILLLTDGMLERNVAAVDVFGLAAATVDLHPRETVQALTSAIVGAAGGKLRDDATALCLDWYGGQERDRQADTGADQARASPPRPAC
jgi:serine phosphatase RsbU (regulator of sigma subunit)